jgi:hypothetical protein
MNTLRQLSARYLPIALLCLLLATMTASAGGGSPLQTPGNNIALNKPAQQSSISGWSKTNDAQGAVDGIKNGSFGFHTNNEKNPWWQVDLQSLASLNEIRVFNRMDDPGRAETIQILLSADGKDFDRVYPPGGAGAVVAAFLGGLGRPPAGAPAGPPVTKFGGTDGKPLVVDLKGAKARYVRLQLNTTGYFHLDEVEIVGTPGTSPLTTQNIAPPASPGSVTGLWTWACCGSRNTGMFVIVEQRPDGTFSGQFSRSNADDDGAIEGRISGDQIEFIRRGVASGRAFAQRWTARIETTGNTRKMTGGIADQATPQRSIGDFTASNVANATMTMTTGGISQTPLFPGLIAGIDDGLITHEIAAAPPLATTFRPQPENTPAPPVSTRTPASTTSLAPAPTAPALRTPSPAADPPPIMMPPPPLIGFSSLTFDLRLDEANNNKMLDGGERFNIRVSITNRGTGVANNVQVRLSGDPLVVAAAGPLKPAGNIAVGATQVLDFNGMMPLQVDPRNAEIRVTLFEGTTELPQGQVLRVGLAPAEVKDTTTVLSEVVDVDYPPALVPLPERNTSVAVIVGISNYRDSGIPKLPYAGRDAETFAKYLENVGGIRKENIKILSDDHATRSDIEDAIENWLPLHVTETSHVYFYYAGHGALDAANGDQYLVPYEGSPDSPSTRMYAMKRLYEKLGQLKAQNVTAFLDSCFSGGGRSIAMRGRPIVIEGTVSYSVSVLAAAGANQVSNDYDRTRHGLFTYFLLKGMRGEADTSKDGWVDLGELSVYVRDRVRSTAATELSREQSPVLNGGADLEAKRAVKLFKFQR